MFFKSSGYTSFFFMLRMVVTSRWRSGWRHRAISTRSAGGKRMPKTYCWNCASKLQSMAIATCITYVFPNSLRQTLWASMKWRFWIRLGESIRKHLRSLRLPPSPQDNVANVFRRWGVDDWNFLASRHANIVLGGSGGLDGSKIRQSVS